MKVGERFLCFSFWGISSGCAFASLFPKKKCPERELCHQALELLPSLTGGGACTDPSSYLLCLRHVSSTASWEALPAVTRPLLPPGLGPHHFLT